MALEMGGFFTNEQKCLSNAVLQACLREQLMATWGIIPLVRRMVQNNAVPVKTVKRVELHQCPQPKGFVQYELHIMLVDGRCYHEEFMGSGFNSEHTTYTLYDRRRDGAVEHLHLLN